MPSESMRPLNDSVSSGTVPRTKFGTVVVTVARRLVPNSSAAVAMNTAQ